MDREAIITGTRISADGTIVSYDLDINGNPSTRYRKFIQNLNKTSNVRGDDTAVESSSDDSGGISGGGGSETGKPG